MKPVFEQTAPASEQEQFGFALFLALAVHALIIFGIGFSLVQSQIPPPTLEVTLARTPSTTAPEDTDYLAQINQQGSGRQSEKQQVTTDLLAPLPSPHITDTIPAPVQTAQQKSGVTTLVSTNANNDQRTSHDHNSDQETPQNKDQLMETTPKELASLQARLDLQRQALSKQPTVTRVTAASTRAAPEAAYLNYWIDRIEQTGNTNYPEEARRRQLFGNLQLAVTIAKDGTVVDIEVLKSSGLPVLDQAASRIVRLAAPFDALPAGIKTDRLEIIRTWKFARGHHLQTGSGK